MDPSIIFCAKHRVNFAMFNPVYQILRNAPGIWLGLSTGCYRKKPILGWLTPKDPELTNEKIFGEFDVDPRHLVKTSWHDKTPYDVYVTSNVSVRAQPRNPRLSVQIFHGVSFRNFAVSPEYLRFDKLFFPGRYMMEQYIARGILAEGDPRIELMGMPKLDRLVDGSIRRNEVLSSLGLDPAVPTVLWCPTGARHNGFELFGHAGLAAIQKLGVNLIVKLHDHPHLKKNQTRDEVLAHARVGLGPQGRLIDHSDVTPLLVAADLLVSDASSVAFEFCNLDRPIVFIDVPQLLANRAGLENNAMDLDTHGRNVGRIVKTPEELASVIQEELKNPAALSGQRRRTASHIFHQPGTAAARMAARLRELASSPSVPVEKFALGRS